MKFEWQKTPSLRNAPQFLVADNKIFGLTGRRVIIVDENGNYITERETPHHTYSAKLSPDGTKILLVSICNEFAVLDVKTLTIRTHTVKDYPGNLEGVGLWSNTGDAFYLPVQKSTANYGVVNTLRRYNAKNFDDYTDYLTDKYIIKEFLFEPKTKKFFLIANDEDDNDCFVWYDEKDFEICKLPKYSYSDTLLDAQIMADKQTVVLWGVSENACFTYQGERLDKEATKAFFAGYEAERQELMAKLPLTRKGDKTVPRCVRTSADGKRIFVGAWERLFILDAKTYVILAEIKINGDQVKDVFELNEKTIVIALEFSNSSARLYRLVE